jgi:LmbE family N-acetylglucosaminyl deacetylase
LRTTVFDPSTYLENREQLMIQSTYKKLFMIKKYLLFILLMALSSSLKSQPEKIRDAAELKLALEKLNVLGSVLYIAAHPDDENETLLSYFSYGKLFRTGYLALTRGDGGQNLLGTEQSDELSVIRTEELLESRKIDGGEQYFSRAIDFGYSKNAEETLNIWNKQKILSDVVWNIRKFRPDIIILRFRGDGSGGHGNHTASSLLAQEAFKIANDPNVFPEQLKYVKPWQPRRVFWNVASWLKTKTPEGSIAIDAGEYNTLLGKTYSEIGAVSRSMNRSQGEGTSPRREKNLNYFQLLDGEPADRDIMEGVNTTWSRIPGGEKVSVLLESANEEFKIDTPWKIIPTLLKAYSEMEKIKDDCWVPLKEKELLNVIKSVAGIWIEATTSDYSSFPGGKVNITAGIVNRSDYPFILKSVQFEQGENKILNEPLAKENLETINTEITLPRGINYTQPYWLRLPHELGSYEVTDQKMIGKPMADPPLNVMFTLAADNVELKLTTPVFNKWNDPISGENYRPFEIRPPVSINLDNSVYVFPDDNEKTVKVTLKSNADNLTGKLELNAPPNWSIVPKEIAFNFENKYDEEEFTIKVKPPLNGSESTITASAITNFGSSDRSMETINYSHIPIQTLFPKAEAKLLRLNIKKVISSIGYIMGAGDLLPDELKELGYNVKLLSDDDLDNADLSKYDAIVAGVRVYNTRKRMKIDQPRLMEYVKNGGTYVVEYSKSRDQGMITTNIGPYPIQISHDRVTVEGAPVTFLNPEHELLNFPNKITQDDFKGWVQERGLYFADNWDPKYETILECKDPGESSQEGGELFTNYGKGVFIYTGYSWFRQLPAGVPGSYKLFVNLISAGKKVESNQQSSK